MIIRKIQIKDIEAIDKIFLNNWIKVYPNPILGITKEDIITKFSKDDDPEQLEKFKNFIKNMSESVVYLVAENEKGVVVGVCRSFVLKDRNELDAIYIDIENQCKGVGTELINQSFVFYNKNNPTILYVADYNEKAIKFYEGLGFVKIRSGILRDKNRMPVSGIVIPETEMMLKI